MGNKLLRTDANNHVIQAFAPASIATVYTATGATSGGNAVTVSGYLAVRPNKTCSYFMNSDMVHTATLMSHSVLWISESVSTIGFLLTMSVEFM